MMNRAVEMRVSVNQFPEDENMIIRATPVYNWPEHLQTIPKRCPIHSLPTDSSNQRK